MKPTNWVFIPSIFTAIALIISGCNSQDSSQPSAQNLAQATVQKSVSVKTFIATNELDQSIRSLPAKVAASDSTNIAFKVSGQVSNIYFQAGDEVKKGDLLLELDSVDFQLGFDQAKANYDLAKATFERISNINKQNLGSASEFDNAKANLELAKVGLDQAKNQLAYTKLTAPYSGILVKVLPKQFEFTSAAQPVAVIQSQDNIDIKFQIPSEIIAQVDSDRTDQLVDIRFAVIKDKTFKAQLKDFQSEGDESTRSFSVTLTMPRPDKSLVANLLPGMEAYVDFDMSMFTPSYHTLVPSNAVFKQQNESYVFKIIDNKAVLTKVSVGQFSNDKIEITQGVNNGDIVVSAGVHSLSDGQSVSVWQVD